MTKNEMAAVTDEERNWAAIAHASTLLSVVVGLATAGVGSLLLALIPLGIYIGFREKSRYVAFHALQATALQLLGLIVYAIGLVALIILTVVVWTVAALLTMLLVGILLYPVALVITLLVVVFALLYPVAIMAYALYAAVETGRGNNYYYVWVGDWLDDIELSWARTA